METSNNCSQINFTHTTCFKFDKYNFETVRWVRIGVATLAGVICCLTLVLMFIFKAYKRFVHRLALYLSIAALLNSVVFPLQVLPVKDECDHVAVSNEDICIAAGVVAEYSGWVILLLTCWTSVHLLILAVFKHNFTSIRCERGGVLICFIVPTAISVIPFIPVKSHSMYGLAGAWCWIKLSDKYCKEYVEGIIEQFTLWYGPVMLFVALNFLVMVVVIVMLYRGKKEAPDELQKQYKAALKDAAPLLLYPVLFSTIYSLAFVNRIYYAATKKAIFPLWVAHAVADPCIPLFIPLAFLLHPYTLKKFNCLQLRKAINMWKHRSIH